MNEAAQSDREGIAREIPQGRLAGFEQTPEPTYRLPPRPRATPTPPSATTPSATTPSATTPSATPPVISPAVVESPAAEEVPDQATPDPAGQPGSVETRPARTRTRRATGDTAPAARAGSVRASNIHIPVDLLGPITRARAEQKTSNGDVIITALEETYDQLKAHFRPPTAAGGSLFARRVSKAPRPQAEGPVTPLNYRLFDEDFQKLDELVDELGASSRSHLISVALTMYFATPPTT